jgi:hypothetical protein
VRHRATEWYTVSTTLDKGWYRSRSGAMSAARWIALESGENVAVSNEATGHTWDVSPAEVEPRLARADRVAAAATP